MDKAKELSLLSYPFPFPREPNRKRTMFGNLSIIAARFPRLRLM
uniref:Uncharacterized protein n=1 Tax=Rhizophora mucronata TaxID=61149 RepID=A0A2P2KNQ4_RHIMU